MGCLRHIVLRVEYAAFSCPDGASRSADIAIDFGLCHESAPYRRLRSRLGSLELSARIHSGVAIAQSVHSRRSEGLDPSGADDSIAGKAVSKYRRWASTDRT